MWLGGCARRRSPISTRSTANSDERAAAAVVNPALAGGSYQDAVRRLTDHAIRVFYQNSGDTPAN